MHISIMIGAINWRRLNITRGHSQRFSSSCNWIVFPCAIKQCNHLPATTIESNNIDDFKNKIVDYFCISPVSYRLNVARTVFFVCTCAYILPYGGLHSINNNIIKNN